MKKGHYLVVLLLFSLFLHAQKEYEGKVIDASTGEPIPYVNIGIVEKGIGTITDEQGLFYLGFKNNEVQPTDIVLFSSLGYASLNIPLIDMQRVSNEYPVFKMKPATVALNEVVVSTKKGTFITDFVGYKKNNVSQSYGYWKDQKALGGEMATKIVVKRGLRRLSKFKFEIAHNPSDSLLLRVNAYKNDGNLGKPKTNLNTSGKNILLTVRNGESIIWVDLEPYDIYVKDDFSISLELLKVYGKEELDLILAAAYEQYGSYRKYASQGKWESVSKRNMAYYLETELLVPESVAKRFEKKESRKKKKLKTISGFTISKGRMVYGVEVFNNRTKESVFSDEKGRYIIVANKKDQIFFRKEGFKSLALTVGEKPTVNIIMKKIN